MRTSAGFASSAPTVRLSIEIVEKREKKKTAIFPSAEKKRQRNKGGYGEVIAASDPPKLKMAKIFDCRVDDTTFV